MEHTFLMTDRITEDNPCVAERYFTPKLIPEKEQCVLVHSNRLCVVTLGPNHPILKENLEVTSVNFYSTHVDRRSNKVSGKHKRGAQKLGESSVLCVAKCSDDKEYKLFSCVSGRLIEINERLVEQPNLMREKPWSDGYIAVILPPFLPKTKDK